MGNIVQPLWNECPACTRLLIVGYPTLSVVLMLAMSSFQNFVILGFMCMLETVLHHYCIWTMFLGFLFRPFQGGMSFLMMMFELYMGMQLLPAKEKDLGSLGFFLWVLLMNFSVNVIFLAAMYAMSVANDSRSYWEQPNSGMWPLIFLLITMQSLSDQDGSSNFWGVVTIPNKWYPLCLLGFFSLMSQAIMWNAAAAVLIGYLYPKLRLERLLPSRTRMSRWEMRCCGSSNRACLGGYFIKSVDTAGYEAESGDRRYASVSDFGRSGQGTQLTRDRDAQNSTQQAAPASNFVVFAGSGNRLGDSDSQPSLPPATAPRPTQP